MGKKTHMKYSNCLIFAIWNALRNGQSIVIEKTKHEYKWPIFKYHFLTLPPDIVEKYATSYVPLKKDLGDWPPPIFKGRVKKGMVERMKFKP